MIVVFLIVWFVVERVRESEVCRSFSVFDLDNYLCCVWLCLYLLSIVFCFVGVFVSLFCCVWWWIVGVFIGRNMESVFKLFVLFCLFC